MPHYRGILASRRRPGMRPRGRVLASSLRAMTPATTGSILIFMHVCLLLLIFMHSPLVLFTLLLDEIWWWVLQEHAWLSYNISNPSLGLDLVKVQSVAIRNSAAVIPIIVSEFTNNLKITYICYKHSVLITSVLLFLSRLRNSLELSRILDH
jgi:hypothetical protein